MTNRAPALVLHRKIRRPTAATLHSREIELGLSDDGCYVTLSRHVERYGDPETAWSGVRHHRVPVARMIRWIISQGMTGAAVLSETDASECPAQETGNPVISAARQRI